MAKAEPSGPGVTYGYGRVSTTKQVNKGYSLEEQRGRIDRYAADRGLPAPVYFIDPGKSGKTPFADREAGGELYRRAKRGDHIIVTKLDRAFRNLFDFLNCFDYWVRTGINVHIIDFGGNSIDPQTPTGKAIISILAVIAQMEREVIGQRTAEAHAFLREQGLYLNPRVPKGFKAVKDKGGRGYRAVPDPYTRELMAEIIRWRDEMGMTLDAIRHHLRTSKVKFPNDRYRYWSPDNVKKLYDIGKQLKEAETVTEV